MRVPYETHLVENALPFITESGVVATMLQLVLVSLSELGRVRQG
jgi:hypothetical protein